MKPINRKRRLKKVKRPLDGGSVAVGFIGAVALAAAAKAFLGLSPEAQTEYVKRVVGLLPKKNLSALPDGNTFLVKATADIPAAVDDYCRLPLDRGLCCSRRRGHEPPCSASSVE